MGLLRILISVALRAVADWIDPPEIERGNGKAEEGDDGVVPWQAPLTPEARAMMYAPPLGPPVEHIAEAPKEGSARARMQAARKTR